MATGTPIPPRIRDAAIRQFTATWHTYRTVSDAVVDVAEAHELGRTTLQEWLMAAELWLSPRRRVVWLEEENAALRAKLAQCQCHRPGSTR